MQDTKDDIASNVQKLEIAFARFEAGVTEKFERYHLDAERFWRDAWPRVEKAIESVADNLALLEKRMQVVELEQAVVKVRLGFWGGIAGVVALAAQIAGYFL